MRVEDGHRERWDGWLLERSQFDAFTQSWAWGDILIAEGKKTERLAVVEDGRVLAQAQVVYNQSPFGWQYAFCPKGPVVVSSIKYQVLSIYELLEKYLKEKKCIFFRIESAALNTEYLIPNTKKITDINPSATLLLDLRKSEEEILAGMHPKTRYNIHLAEKKGLRISEEKNMEVFWLLMNKTGSRDKFSLHHKIHYEKVLQSAATYQLTAYENEKPVACAVFARFGNILTYLYGASDYEYRNLMAPYLLQWEGIKMGKNFGCQRYDFFGVAPNIPSFPRRGGGGLPDTAFGGTTSATPLTSPLGKGGMTDNNVQDRYIYDLNHQYAGVTRFKLGFGGAPHQTAGTWDVVIDNKKYKLYNFLRRLRRLV